ncbi:alpha/beta fold hydrolase [Streptomyces sp. NPDC002537]
MSPQPPLSAEQARRLPDYPFQGRWFSHGAWHQHFLDEGRGSPVLMVHGSPTWSYMWRRLVLGLRGRYRCVVPDLRGMGLSDRARDPDGELLAESRAKDLGRLVDHLTAEHGAPRRGWTLVVHDWGGPIGMWWAHLNPGVVDRLVVLNTAAFPMPPGYRLPWAARALRRGPVGRIAHASNAVALLALRQGPRRPLPRPVHEAYLAPYRRQRDRPALVRFARDIPLSPADPGWPHAQRLGEALVTFTQLPVFVGWGMRDPLYDDLVLAEWTRRLPQAELHLYPYAGHYVLEDMAWQLVEDIRDFLVLTDHGRAVG